MLSKEEQELSENRLFTMLVKLESENIFNFLTFVTYFCLILKSTKYNMILVSLKMAGINIKN